MLLWVFSLPCGLPPYCAEKDCMPIYDLEGYAGASLNCW